jgi:hypothetical protein
MTPLRLQHAMALGLLELAWLAVPLTLVGQAPILQAPAAEPPISDAAVSRTALAQPAGAQQPVDGRAASAATLKFRRVFAPAERVQDWPRGTTRYVPVEPAEFERLVERARDIPGGATVSPVAHTTRAVYEARLDEQTTLLGQATLEIAHTGDAPAAMPLEPCGLALGDCSWQSPTSRPATLGLRDDGKLAVLVASSGQLKLDWSLRRRRDGGGPASFQLQLPACPATTLILDLPDDCVPVPERGIVVGKSAAEKGRLKWRIELGGLNRLALRLAPREADNGSPAPIHLRETLTYDLAPRGVDVTAQWKLDVRAEPLRRMEVELEPGLRVVNVRYGDADIAWSVSRDPKGDEDPSHIVLEFPEPILGADRVVRLAAVAPVSTDQPWRLPRIRPRGVLWHEGSITLLVRAPLILDDLAPSSCRQIRTGPLPAPAEGEAVELQCFGPEATVELALRRRQKNLQISAGTTVRLTRSAAVAEVTADLRTADAGRFLLEADVARDWNIDSVQSTPREALGDWSQDATDAQASVLHVRFARSLGPNSPVKLLVRGRRSLPAAAPDGAAQATLASSESTPPAVALAGLEMLNFRNATTPLRLLALVAGESSRLRLTAERDLSRVPADHLTPYEQALLTDEEHADYILRLSSELPKGHVSIENERPRYTADVRIRASVSGGQLMESYTLRCTPQSKRLDRVVVCFTPPRDEPLRWSIGDEGRGQLVARRVDGRHDATAGVHPGQGDPAKNGPPSETWEVILLQPRSAPFELHAARSTAYAAELSVALALLPEATGQQSVLSVSAASDVPLVIHNHGLQEVEPEPVAADQFSTTRAAYRYEPSDIAASVGIAPSTGVPKQATAWAWSCQTDSRLEEDGRLVHSLAYRIENRGRQRVSFRVPPELDVTRVWVDRTPIDAKEENGRVVVDLPPERAFVTIIVQCQSSGPRLGWFSTIEAPRVEPDLLVLSQRFRLWTPPGYEAISSSDPSGNFRSPGLSWSQRLFGPLGRAADRTPFDPLAMADWRHVFGSREGLEKAASSAREIAQRLTTLSAATSPRGAGVPEMDWSELLVETQRAADSSALSLFVDWQALGELGIGPRIPALRLPPQEASGSPDSFLARAKLRLLVCGDAAVLTSGTAAAVDRGQMQTSESGTLGFVRPGPLADEIRAAAAGVSCRYVPPEKWGALAAVTWSDAPADAAPWMDDAVWDAIVIEPGRDGALRAMVVRRSLVQSTSWAVFLLVVAFSWWALRGRDVVMIVMAGLFVALALVLPAAYAPLASGGVLGTIVSMLVTRCFPRPVVDIAHRTTDRSSNSGSRKVRVAQTALLLLAGVSIATCPVPSQAQPRPSEAKQAGGDVHSVFIPVDDKNNPTGGKYQVPEGFYAELRRRAAAATGEPQGWLLQSAGYRAALVRDVLLQRVVLKDLTAAFDVQVFADGTRVRLPIGSDQVELVAGGALLDARPVSLVREADGRTVSLEVAEAGMHHLELSLRAVVEITGEASVLDLRIPPLASSTLDVLLPTDPPDVELPEAVGKWSMAQDRQKLSARLGPSSRLVVRWTQREAARDASAEVDVDELLWLHVQQGAVVLQGKFKFKVHSGRVQQLQFAIDPHLRPLPSEAVDSPVARIETLPGDPQTLRLDLSRPVADQVTVPLKFLVTGASGVGTLSVPRLEVLGARSMRRWLAISVDPDLDFNADKLVNDNTLAVPDFVAQWGLVASGPQLAIRAPQNESGGSLSTRPRPKRMSARQSLAISANPGRLVVRFDARLTDGGGPQHVADGYTFRHRLRAPPELQIDSVSAIEEGVQRVARWARSPQGDVVVFLTAPASGPQQLSLRGWLPAPESGRLPLPFLRLVEADVHESVVHVWRQPAARVAVEDLVNLVETSEPARADDAKDLGRLVGSYLVDGQDAQATLVLAPNEPRIRANQVTSVSRDANAWEAKVDYRCTVENGLLDLLRFDVPSDWPGPYEFTPAVPYELVSGGGENRRQIIVRPRAAIQGDFRLAIRGPLRNGGKDAVVVPDVVPAEAVPLPAGATSRFLVLPTQIGLERIQWETTGLRPAPLPKEMAEPSPVPAASASFMVVGDAAGAKIKAAENAAAPAGVRRADVRIASQADGGYRGLAVFDLRVVGEAFCQLQIPSDLEVVHIAVAGAPVTPLPLAESQWRIPLVAGKLEQQVEIVFASPGTSTLFDRRIRLRAPTIDDWPVEQSEWTVYDPIDSGRGDARIEVAAITGNADRVAVGGAAADGAAPETAAGAAHSPPASSALVADMTLGRWRQHTRLSSPGAISRATVEYPHSATRDRLGRLAAALLVLAATAWFARRRNKILAADYFARWPYATGVALGIAWWLWMTPSGLGLVCIAVSAFAAVRGGWLGAGPRGAGVVGVGVAGVGVRGT